jgi:hypothetical protein
MRLGAISDLHLYPGATWTKDLRGVDKLVIVGDCFNLIPLGISSNAEEWWETAASLYARVPEDTTWILGNHEGRLEWLRKVLWMVPPERIVRTLDLTIEGKPYHFEHGHMFSEWRWLSMIAPAITEYLTTNALTRKWWYGFCSERGWLASGLPQSSERYELLVSMIWGWASLDADRHKRCNVIGHSHHGPMRTDNLIDCGAGELVEVG